jgi:hypothetical protein
MIRPFTFVCFLLACGSGLYLYQAKHRVQVLDHEIEKTVRATEELRERIRVLHAEWTLQNDPQRLQSLADRLLALKTVTPGQFTSLADLDSRLPQVPPPEAPSPPVAPLAASPAPPADTPPPEEPRPVPVAVSKPVPPPSPPPPAAPKPAAVAATEPAPRPPEREHQSERDHEHRPLPPPSRPAIAEGRPVSAPVRPVASSRPIMPPMSAAITGSALGMARSTSLTLPRPMPVSASRWVSNGNGGG